MILQREVLKEIVLLFVISLTALFSMLLVGRLFKLKDLLVGQHSSLVDIGKLLVFLTPFLLNLILPVVCMLSIFLVFLRMGADREITALNAGGVSPLRFLPAPFLFCLLLTGLSLANSMFGISWGMTNFRQTVFDMARTKARIALQPGVFNQDFPYTTFFVRNIEPRGETLLDIFIRTERDGTAYIVAPKGSIVTDHENGRIFFSVQDGTLYHQKDNDSLVLGFDEYRLQVDISRWLKNIEPSREKIKYMSFPRLVEMLRNKDESNAAIHQVQLELHKRFSQPFSCMILGCFALPLALLFQGLRRQYGIVLTFFLFLLYYALSSAGETLGKSGTLPPALAIWQANLFFFLLFIFFMVLSLQGKQMRIFRFFHLFKREKK